jgi:copper chaperone CopZ
MRPSFGIVAACVLMASAGLYGQDGSAPAQVTRAVASLNGVFSPRGFFNLTVRLYQLPGVEWAKYDLKKSRITLDFKPGVTVTPKEIEQVMVGAGYKPGPVKIEVLEASAASQTGPGWVRIKHPTSKNAVIRWFQLNF